MTIHAQKQSDNKEHKGDNGHGNDFVKIYINGANYSIHRGHQTVAVIKNLAGVSSTDVLYQMPDYVELGNSDAIVIRGEEHFKSVAPSGSSS